MAETWERLKVTLAELGIEPKKSLGQNFLVSDTVIGKIVKAAKDFKPDFLLEIGPGPGALTFHLKEILSNFQVIELDRVLAAHWREKGLSVTEGDALQIDWSAYLSQTGRRILVSNLPYQISSSLVIERCLDENPLDAMVLMFQKEVAQRLRARQGDELYGMLSVVTQTFWKTEMLVEVGPRDFFPPPKVASRVVTFQKLPSPVKDRKHYLKFVKACFLHPRKLMVSNLVEGFNIPKEKALAVALKLNLGEKVRAGELTLKQFLDFYHELS